MKKVSLVLVVSLLFLSNGYLEAGKRGKKDPSAKFEKMMKKLDEKLSLSEDQKSKLKTLNSESISKYSSAREEYKNKLNIIEEERLSKIKSILTAEQYTKYLEFMVKKGRKYMKRERWERKGGS